MADIKRTRRRSRPESGATETTQVTQITPGDEGALSPVPPEALDSAGEQAAFAPSAALTGPEWAELRARNDTVDWARAEANRLQADAVKMARLGDMGQATLTDLIMQLGRRYNLDPQKGFRVDIERGLIVAGG